MRCLRVGIEDKQDRDHEFLYNQYQTKAEVLKIVSVAHSMMHSRMMPFVAPAAEAWSAMHDLHLVYGFILDEHQHLSFDDLNPIFETLSQLIKEVSCHRWKWSPALEEFSTIEENHYVIFKNKDVLCTKLIKQENEDDYNAMFFSNYRVKIEVKEETPDPAPAKPTSPQRKQSEAETNADS